MIYAFIDTSIIIQKNFDFKSTLFKRLIDLTNKSILNIFHTYISDSEIINGIDSSLQNAKSRLASSKLKSDIKVLRNFDLFSIIFSKDYDKIFREFRNDLISRYQTFLSNSNSIEIPIDESNTIDIFKSYFQKKPPFGVGKKKNEFPDAFILSVLHNYSIKNQIYIYVVSNDNDMKTYCLDKQYLIEINSLEDLLGIASKAEYKEETINAINKGIIDHRKEIEHRISYLIDSSDVSLVDVDGFVNEIEIENVNFEFDQVLNVEVDKGIVTISGDADLLITLKVNYHDPGTSITDGTYVAIGSGGFDDHYNARKIINRNTNMPVVLDIKTDEYNEGNPDTENYGNKFEVLNVEIVNNASIDISIFSNE
ncbi:hypothetical protein DSCO28_03080 [Desulfosarcina ovata subsp. sediminis]|uniref:DUF4935 domain-containing protein n=1 Tax=Desulfosarcina ovata subsp. sediminis TaxID=885957 RepID=A0A5K7ZCM3_9BACT|nr:PIN domain-containing protein [Desulfosarcina ovata]BBO79742.1 hypothetical protein DSCO28_03080 [Desulfosarcina ovata subsp. sediminis]